MSIADIHTGKRRSPSNAAGKARYDARIGRAPVVPEIMKTTARPQTAAERAALAEPVQTPDGAAWPIGSRYMVWTWPTEKNGIGCNTLPGRRRRS